MNFDDYMADLDSQPITGFDHSKNWINLPLISHITDNLYVGGHDMSVNLGDYFTHVFSFYTFDPQYVTDESTTHHGWTMYDSPDYPDLDTLDEAVPLIVAALEAGGNVLVHCQAGINRSNLATSLVLMDWKGLTAAEAIDMLREKRGQVVLSNQSFERYLRSLDAHIDVCEHNEENKIQWEGWVPPEGSGFCGLNDLHGVHGKCLGIMCDYGCNAENF